MKVAREVEEQKILLDFSNNSSRLQTWKDAFDKESIILDFDKEIDNSSATLAKEIIAKTESPTIKVNQSTSGSTPKVNISGLSAS